MKIRYFQRGLLKIFKPVSFQGNYYKKKGLVLVTILFKYVYKCFFVSDPSPGHLQRSNSKSCFSYSKNYNWQLIQPISWNHNYFFNFFQTFLTSSLKVISATKKNFFLSWESYVLFSRYLRFCIFNHLMIYQICDIMMNIIIWDRMHFWLYILNHNSLSNQIWPIDRCKQGQ